MLTVESATIVVGRRVILQDVSMSVPAGRLTVIIGPNGAGKSTLLRALSGELSASRGRVLLSGRALSDMSARELARRRSVMPQASHLGFPFLTEEVVALGASVPAFGASIVPAATLQAIDLADVRALLGRYYNELSGGERQRVQFARAMCQLIASRTAPEETVLLLDEPTANLDLPHQMLLMGHARAEARRGRTVVAVLHDLNLAATWADSIAALAHGRLVGVGTPAEVMTDRTLSRLYGYGITVSREPQSRLPAVLPQSFGTAENCAPDRSRRDMTVVVNNPAQPAESQPCD